MQSIKCYSQTDKKIKKLYDSDIIWHQIEIHTPKMRSERSRTKDCTRERLKMNRANAVTT